MPGFNPWVGKIPRHKKMAPHSSILAWKIPWAEEPGMLQSMATKSQTRLSDWAPLTICKPYQTMFCSPDVKLFFTTLCLDGFFFLCLNFGRGEKNATIYFPAYIFPLAPHPRLFWQNFLFICVPGAPVVDTGIKQHYFILRVTFFFCLLCWSVNPPRLLGKELTVFVAPVCCTWTPCRSNTSPR